MFRNVKILVPSGQPELEVPEYTGSVVRVVTGQLVIGFADGSFRPPANWATRWGTSSFSSKGGGFIGSSYLTPKPNEPRAKSFIYDAIHIDGAAQLSI